jgi:Domain of unknown function (DUF4249)
MTLSYAAILLSLMALWRCKDKYVSPYKNPVTGYLVVQGYVSGNSPTSFTLTRTIALPGGPVPSEIGASVEVDGLDGSVFPLPEQSPGVYSDSNALPLNTAVYYQLRIKTSNGEQYLSDTVPCKITPPIDSLYFSNITSTGTTIYLNTHDPTGKTRFYLWNYVQTFEYHSAEETSYYYDEAQDTVLPRPDTSQVFSCWLSGSGADVLTNTSEALAQDVIYQQPMVTIPPNNVQLSVLYTMLARQYALTDSGYAFYKLLQQNTEDLGSIFDAQPSQITGNVHCLTVPTERVIGWVSAGTVQQYRLWISRAQVPSTFAYQCAGDDIQVPADPIDIKTYFGSVYTPISPSTNAAGQPIWLANYTDCLVCTFHGGTNHAPNFWPN